MSVSYWPISARSILRSAVRPKTSSAVPRNRRSFASTPKARIIHGPYTLFLASPVVGSGLLNTGGARWNVSL